MFLHHEYTKLSHPKQDVEGGNFICKSVVIVEQYWVNQ